MVLCVSLQTVTSCIRYDCRCARLTKVFNALPRKSHLRYEAYVGIVTLSAQCDAFASVSTQFGELAQWLIEWGATAAEQLTLSQLVNTALLARGNGYVCPECAACVCSLNETPPVWQYPSCLP